MASKHILMSDYYNFRNNLLKTSSMFVVHLLPLIFFIDAIFPQTFSMTVWEHLDFYASLKGKQSKKERKADIKR